MTFDKWLEEIEMRGLETKSIDRLSLAVAFKKGLTPAQFVEQEAKKNPSEDTENRLDLKGITISTDLLIRILTLCGFSMYFIAISMVAPLYWIIEEYRKASEVQTGIIQLVSPQGLMQGAFTRGMGTFFLAVVLVATGTLILLLSKSIRVNAKRFEADLW